MFNQEQMAYFDEVHQANKAEWNKLKPNMSETKVVNLKTEEYDVYIGRAGKGQDGTFGNPHTLGMVYCPHCKGHHDRAGAIEAFKKDFLIRVEKDMVFRAKVLALKGKRLGCFCKPLACHGDVIKEWLDNQQSPVKIEKVKEVVSTECETL